MRKKRKSIGRHEQNNAAPPSTTFDSPFKDLKKLFKQSETGKPASPVEAKPADYTAGAVVVPPADDLSLFLQAVEGARPIAGSGRARVVPEHRVSRAIVSEDAEVLAELYDLVSGQKPFELTETEEYVEGARVGLDPRLVTRLRKGEFAVQAHLDLHGMVQGAARAALTEFILESARKGLRTVLVVHGRGRRSPGGQPVLKHAAAQWLSHGTLCGYVLAFTTARPQDGGPGAMCVLLRRERRRAPFDVLHGTTRHRD
jgi:DNA-nicking Smr family endonuclease